MKITVDNKGQIELSRFRYEILAPLQQMLGLVPLADLVDLSLIIVTDLSNSRDANNRKVMGSYFQKTNNKPAYIELYANEILGHINNIDQFKMMCPILEYGLATTLYHEIGHHVRVQRSHGIKKSTSEKFANAYKDSLIFKYVLAYSESIDNSFKQLEIEVEHGKADRDVVTKMKAGWEKTFYEANKSQSK
jgi:hypothetical protein